VIGYDDDVIMCMGKEDVYESVRIEESQTASAETNHRLVTGRAAVAVALVVAGC
jgi:hypothetical protein